MSELDPLIHAPKRLRIMTILKATDTVEFAFLQDRLRVSTSDLSKQMSALNDASYVRITKSGRGPGSTTWYSLTPNGRNAYARYMKALKAVLEEPAGATTLNENGQGDV